MHFINEEILKARAIPAPDSKIFPSKWLILSAGKSVYFDASVYAVQLREAISNRDKRSVNVETSDVVVDSLSSARRLVRLIQQCDAIQLFYDGTVHFNKSILPAAMIARFFGKDFLLFYYPFNVEDKIPGSHRLTLKRCRKVYVGSRYLQMDLAKINIKSEVMLRPVTANLLPARIISRLQPHILVKFNSASEAGVVSVMKAVGIVRQKYPRTELTVLTDDPQNWIDSTVEVAKLLQRHECKRTDDAPELQTAFSNADLFVNCSPDELLQPVLLAAMLSGLPIISMETYGAREVIENGVNGLLIRPNEHSHLADKIIKLIEEPSLTAAISKEAGNIKSRLTIDNFARVF